jgi:hypothetical protein
VARRPAVAASAVVDASSRTEAQLYVEEHGAPDDDAHCVDAQLEAVLQG